MKVHLTYFKRTGKYYADGEFDHGKFYHPSEPDPSLYEIWDIVEHMFHMKKRPGLCDGEQEFITLVNVPDHPHNHPHLIFPVSMNVRCEHLVSELAGILKEMK